jgi:hypothetical protein
MVTWLLAGSVGLLVGSVLGYASGYVVGSDNLNLTTLALNNARIQLATYQRKVIKK